MSYALGTKLIPGQIAFQTTRTGRLPSLQPLIEAGLPYAPYIEHGSWTTGRPDIARYGRDPYRGLGFDPADVDMHCVAGGGRWNRTTQECEGGSRSMEERARAAQEVIEGTVRDTIRTALPPTVMILTGVVTGAAGGIAGGLFGKALWGGLAGAAGGGLLGYLGWRLFARDAARGAVQGAVDDVIQGGGLRGIPAVL